MVRVIWTDEATQDLKKIYDFISLDSKFYARRQLTKLRRRTVILKTFPNSGEVVAIFDDDQIRTLVEGVYIILYKVMDVKLVAILAVHHSARNIETTLRLLK